MTDSPHAQLALDHHAAVEELLTVLRGNHDAVAQHKAVAEAATAERDALSKSYDELKAFVEAMTQKVRDDLEALRQ